MLDGLIYFGGNNSAGSLRQANGFRVSYIRWLGSTVINYLRKIE